MSSSAPRKKASLLSLTQVHHGSGLDITNVTTVLTQRNFTLISLQVSNNQNYNKLLFTTEKEQYLVSTQLTKSALKKIVPWDTVAWLTISSSLLFIRTVFKVLLVPGLLDQLQVVKELVLNYLYQVFISKELSRKICFLCTLTHKVKVKSNQEDMTQTSMLQVTLSSTKLCTQNFGHFHSIMLKSTEKLSTLTLKL